MFTVPLAIALVFLTGAPSRTEKIEVERLHTAILNMDLSASPDKGALTAAEFEKQFPRASLRWWRNIQKRVGKHIRARTDVSFLLAFYGVNYSANVQWMMRVYRDYVRDPRIAMRDEVVIDALETLPSELGDLYLRRHSLSTLRLLLSLSLDGSPSECLTEETRGMFEEHRHTVMSAANGEPYPVHNLLSVLLEEIELSASGSEVRASRTVVRGLEADQRSSDRRVARTARALLLAMRSRAKRST